MQTVSLITGKTLLKLMKLTGHGGSALPGLVIEKTDPQFLARSLAKLPKGVVIVSGTNGKTTTTKTIADLLEGQGLKVLTNKSGSNFVRGIISTLAKRTKLNGQLPYDIAVFEQDEAHAVRFADLVKPNGVVVLNVLRDQLDRFGEIDTTAKHLQKLVTAAKDFVVLNGNDERVGNLHPQAGVNTFMFGHSEELQSNFLSDDEFHSVRSPVYKLAGQLFCELRSYDDKSVSLKINGQTKSYTTELNGSHNWINLAAAVTTVLAILPDVNSKKLENSIRGLKPAFGRGESFTLDNGSQITLQLVKNPASFSHNLRNHSLYSGKTVGIAINDDYPDGRDVSWLYDVDFSNLKSAKDGVVCAGTRGYDMAVRLKYDDVAVQEVAEELGKFVESVTRAANGGPATIFCTYTAMLKIRAIFKKKHKAVGGIEL